MAIFKQKKDKLIPIQELKIDLERDLQVLTEKNLEAVFGLQFIATEFQLQNLRIDTLAFDKETNSFVIIEYKRDRSFSIIDQGFAYLSLMLNNEAAFILEYNEKTGKVLDRKSINWSQSRVLFLASSFTTHQVVAVNFKDLPIELWKVKKFDNGMILYNQVEASGNSESINKVTKNKEIAKVSKEIKRNSVDDHFKSDWEKSRELYEIVSQKILALDPRIEENPNPKPYIGYRIGTANLFAIHTYKTKIVLVISRTQPSDLKDPEKKALYRLNSFKHYNQHLTDIVITTEEDIDYAMFLAKQGYKKYLK
ncbi:MAG: hypothetical protein KIH67_001505 [Candidatus Moranbacteria bacterium]|nr:hypothetical protein [Candidatus Moranbacteria bacterium]